MIKLSNVESPGYRPAQVFAKLDDYAAASLLPPGVLDLIKAVDPERLIGTNRDDTLGKAFSVELAVDDLERRKVLIEVLPELKIAELEARTDTGIDRLLSVETLEPAVRRAILGFFGVPTTPEAYTDETAASVTVRPNRGLFPHQKRAAASVEKYLYIEDGRVMLHLPTGVGKTRTAMSVVASHLRNRSSGLVLWLAVTRELLEQAAIEFMSLWNVVGDREVECIRFWSNYDPPIGEVTDGVVFAGLAKLHSYGLNRKQLWDLGDRTTFVVFDEAHQAVANTYMDIVETVTTRGSKTPLLGLSATPGRTWGDPEQDAIVADLFFGNKVTIEVEGANPIKKLTDDRYLAKVSFSLLNVEPGLRLSDHDVADIKQALDLPDAIANRLGEDEGRNLRIVQRLINLSDNHSRILVYAASVSNAVLLTSICRGVGLNADVVTGGTHVVERDVIIQRFKRVGGPSRILINFGVLTTGFDAPSASAALIARPTKSLVLYSQMVGRIIRGPKAGGTENCEVVTVVDTSLPGFGDVAEAFMNWEDVWKAT
ncbi:MAG: DEAD/DEAH box helicase family protein [Gemmatimonadetes bacterium]|nr:DEAD/DEAH box helicase family protein [Gemmatimonadota bacterium]